MERFWASAKITGSPLAHMLAMGERRRFICLNGPFFCAFFVFASHAGPWEKRGPEMPEREERDSFLTLPVREKLTAMGEVIWNTTGRHLREAEVIEIGATPQLPLFKAELAIDCIINAATFHAL